MRQTNPARRGTRQEFWGNRATPAAESRAGTISRCKSLLLMAISMPLLGAANGMAVEPEFPYAAIVFPSGVSVRSGPSSNFYMTDRLNRGDRVEVFRHDDGWAAIRPPEGSFSWIPAEAVELSESPSALRVVEAGVRTRIGSRYGQKHSAEYMPLELDEPLEVLGQQELAETLGGELRLWYKIVPPPGECRWVPLSAIQSEAEWTHESDPYGNDQWEILSTDAPEIEEADLAPPLPPHPVAIRIDAMPSTSTAKQPFAAAPSASSPPSKSSQTAGELSRLEPPVGLPPDTSPTEDEQITTIRKMANHPEYASTSDRSSVTPTSQNDAITEPHPARAAIAGVQRDPEGTAPPSAPNNSSGVAQVQWAYDLAPRTEVDRVARKTKAWREVARFGNPPASQTSYSDIRVATLPGPTSPPLRGDMIDDGGSRSQGERTQGETTWDLPAVGPIEPKDGGSRTMPLALSPRVEAGSPPSTGTVSREYLQQELLDIDLRLAEMAMQTPSQWSLRSLRGRTEAVIDMSGSAEVRDDAQRMLAKIAQFEDVQRRHDRMMMSQVASADNASLSATARSSRNLMDSPINRAIATANYDGSGWLMPVVTAGKGVPRYVLTDDHGRVLKFVTPQPGMNLRNYVRQRVGVYGPTTRVPSLSHPHVVAERVVSLDLATRR